jgi:lipid A ethanolaminephosphotransferase
MQWQAFRSYFQRAWSVNQLIITLSLYFTFVLNFTFLSGFIRAILRLEHSNPLFVASVPLVLLCLMVLVFSLFSIRYITKPAFILLTIVSSMVAFAGFTYGVVFDYGMIQNVFETNAAEASMYINVVSIISFLFTGALPAYLIYRIDIAYKPFFQELLSRVKLIAISLLCLVVLAWAFYSSYAAVARNNSHLKRFIVPTQWVSSGYKYIRDHYFTEPRQFQILDANPQLQPLNNGEKRVFVLIIGETARAKNFQYQGYERTTNRYTAPYQPTYFSQVASCGTATAVSVPCIFSSLTHDNFDRQQALSQQNLLDLAKAAGVDVLWIDNNSGCQNVCERVTTIQLDPKQQNPLCDGKYCVDEILLPEVKQKLSQLSASTTLIVLHVIGSHGPTYYRRYPKSHQLFTPDCPQSDIQNCTHEQLVNTYDNTLAYTDYVVSEVMATLSAQQSIDASLMYVSDHGESLGENGMYLHGFPYALAPSEQTHVPMYLWRNQSGIEQSNCLQQLAKSQAFSHDNVFHSVLGALGVSSTLYQASLDIYQQCQQ